MYRNNHHVMWYHKGLVYVTSTQSSSIFYSPRAQESLSICTYIYIQMLWHAFPVCMFLGLGFLGWVTFWHWHFVLSFWLFSEHLEQDNTYWFSNYRVNDLHNGLAEQTRKREEAMHALDVVQREREHAAENERIKLQSRIAEIAEEVSKKILHKEIKLREEATDKFSKIEKVSDWKKTWKITHQIEDHVWELLIRELSSDLLCIWLPLASGLSYFFFY